MRYTANQRRTTKASADVARLLEADHHPHGVWTGLDHCAFAEAW